MNVTILDTQTGETEKMENQRPFEWAHNNWSCDCNRQDQFDVEPIEACVSRRFIVTEVSFTPQERANNEVYSLRELNAEYPGELLARYLKP